jgi:uncharacterized protein (DUF2062 family)
VIEQFRHSKILIITIGLQRDIKRTFLGNKILRPLLGILKTGISPGQLAVAFSLGIVVGIIPLLGSTTLICMLLAFILRLNLPALQLANYIVFPLQLLLFIPFFKMGGYLFDPLQIPASVTQIREMIREDFLGTIRQFWFANLQALLVWLILAIPSYLLLYFIFLGVFKKISFLKLENRID